MSVRLFNELPDLLDLMPSGGRIGFEYALVASKNMVRAQHDSWDMVTGQPAFEVEGPMGTCPVVLMGKGKSVPGASSSGGRVVVWFDPDISDATGLWLEGDSLDKEKASGQGKVQGQESQEGKEVATNKGGAARVGP